MSTLVAINTLASRRPTVDASAVTVAEWYERKAAVLREIADTCWPGSERDTYESLADQAHQHALRLLAAPGRNAR